MSSSNNLLEIVGHEYKSGIYDKVVLAVGSTEYHGEHLPYGTDTFVAEYLAKEVSQRVEGLLMLPTLPFGMSHHYSSFPISISLKSETLVCILTEIFDSLYNHGLKRLLIINGHDGNTPAINVATIQYRVEHQDFKIAVLESWWETAGQLLPENTFEVWNGLGHGGEGETSMMLKIDPKKVCMRKAQGIIPDLPEKVNWVWTFEELTPYGVTGDPTKATLQKGSLMSKVLLELLVDFIKEMDSKNWEMKHNLHLKASI
jgi:creatinine amidohydrolase